MAREKNPFNDMNAENQFWLGILRDHTQFLMDALLPRETALLAQTQQFFQGFSQLLEMATSFQSSPINQEAAQLTLQFRCFQQNIVNLFLAGQVPVNLPPGAINEMLDEDDEYLRILNVIPVEPLNRAAYLLHQHQMWLSNNAAHAALIRSQLDPGETALFKLYNRFCHLFHNLYLKTLELKGLMRDNPQMAPALTRLTQESVAATQDFLSQLENLRQLRLTAQALAIIPPPLLEHFIREGTYYLQKIG